MYCMLDAYDYINIGIMVIQTDRHINTPQCIDKFRKRVRKASMDLLETRLGLKHIRRSNVHGLKEFFETTSALGDESSNSEKRAHSYVTTIQCRCVPRPRTHTRTHSHTHSHTHTHTHTHTQQQQQQQQQVGAADDGADDGGRKQSVLVVGCAVGRIWHTADRHKSCCGVINIISSRSSRSRSRPTGSLCM